MIFLVQLGINKHLSTCKCKTPNCTGPMSSCNLKLVFEKFTRAFLFQIALEKSCDYPYKLRAKNDHGNKLLYVGYTIHRLLS